MLRPPENDESRRTDATSNQVGHRRGRRGGGDDDEAPITGNALEQAKAAALAETGGGTVTETEVGDEESLYEVEVTLDDGRQVDVQLDDTFTVVGSETDGEDSDADDD